MADIDLDRARNLLKSARELYEHGEVYGVAGLAYQAFESATTSMLKAINGKDQHSHEGRRKRAKELLRKYRGKIDFIWEARNIDFYGNIRLSEDKREITRQEVKESIVLIEKMIGEVEKLLSEPQ